MKSNKSDNELNDGFKKKRTKSQERISNVNRSSTIRPQNIQQVLVTSRSQDQPQKNQQLPQLPPQQQQQQQQSQQQQQQQSQQRPQQQQRSGNASKTGRPSLLVRRGTLRNSKQKKQQQQQTTKSKKQQKNKQTKRTTAIIQKRIAKVKSKIKEELNREESDQKALVGKHTCKNILYFVIVYSVVLCLRSAVESYTEGMAHQPTQKYYFSHSSMGILNGVKLIGFICSITYVAFYARNSHKPLLIVIGVMLCCLGSIVWPAPHFIDDDSFSQSLKQCGDQPTLGFYYSEMCQYRNKSRLTDITLSNLDICSTCVLKNKDPWWTIREVRFSIMCVGGFLIGIGTGLFATSGIVYVEENGDKDTCPIYYGILMCMTGLGQFLGSCLAWWFHGYSENLTARTKLESWEIRAWWFGMVILSIALFFISFVFLIFPKWISEPFWISEKKRQKLRYLNLYSDHLTAKLIQVKEMDDSKAFRSSKRSNKDKNSKKLRQFHNSSKPNHFDPSWTPLANGEIILNEVLENGVVENNYLGISEERTDNNLNMENPHQIMISTVEIADQRDKSIPRIVKPRPNVSKKLGKRWSRLRDIFMVPGFSLALLGVCIAAYFPAGYRTFLTTYVHHQYQLPPIHAWFYTIGLSYSLAWCIGPCIGSLIIYKLQLTIRKQLVLLMLILLFHISLFFFMFPISCQSAMNVPFNSSVERCLDACSCSHVQREAVCTTDGTMYVSTCHASCSINLTCNCTNTTQVSATNCISNCPIYGLYWFFLFLATTLFSMGSVSVILIFLRTVDDEYKTMSISVAFWMVIVAAYVPGTAVFNGIADSSCSEYRKNCLSEDICIDYKLDQFRYFVNGSNVAFQGGAFVVFLIIFILSTVRKIRFGQEFNVAAKLSFQDNSEDVERETTSSKRKNHPRKNVSHRMRLPSVTQEEKLRRHRQLVEVLEKSSSSPDISGRARLEATARNSNSSNLQDGTTPSNDSSTQRLIEATQRRQQQQQQQQQDKPRLLSTDIQLPNDRPLSTREMVEHYLLSIPDDFVYSRQVSMETEAPNPERAVVMDPADVRIHGVDNLAYDPRESFLANENAPRRDVQKKSVRSSNPDEILFM